MLLTIIYVLCLLLIGICIFRPNVILCFILNIISTYVFIYNIVVHMLPTVIYIQKYKYTKIQECDTCLNMEHTEHTEHTENTALNLDFTVYEFSVNKDGKFTTIKIIQDNNSSGSGSGNDSGIGGDSNGSDSDSSGSSGSDSDSSSSNNVSSGNSSIISNNSTFNYNEYLKTVDLTSINIINICCIFGMFCMFRMFHI